MWRTIPMNEKIKKQIIQITSQYPDILTIYLFGSRAIGDANEMSDIDLAVHAPNLSKRDWLDFCDELENEVDTLLKIDVIHYDVASEKLRQEINQHHSVLYSR